jgi:hypothetical protein
MNLIKTQLMPTIPHRTPLHPHITVTPLRFQQQLIVTALNPPTNSIRRRGAEPPDHPHPRIINRNPQVMINHQKEVGVKTIQRRNQNIQHMNQFVIRILPDVKTKSKQLQRSHIRRSRRRRRRHNNNLSTTTTISQQQQYLSNNNLSTTTTISQQQQQSLKQ